MGGINAWRNRNRRNIINRGGAGSSTYEDSLRAIVEQAEILEPAAAVRQTEEVFERPDGSRRNAEEIVRGFARKNIELIPQADDTVIALDLGYINDAGYKAKRDGLFQTNVSLLPRSPQASGFTAGNVNEWINDPVARARFVPEEADPMSAVAAVRRAREMGLAEASGDRQAVFEANKRYDFTPEEIDFISSALLKNTPKGAAPLRSSVRTSGLQGRTNVVLDPTTGERVIKLNGPMRNQYYYDRSNMALGKWLEGGGTGFNEPSSNVIIPGMGYELEHDNPFSKSIDVLKSKSGYYSDTPENTAGFLNQPENSEKAEMDPTDYFYQRRLHAIAADAGIDLNGVIKAKNNQELSGEEALMEIMERDNRSIYKKGTDDIKNEINKELVKRTHNLSKPAVYELLSKGVQLKDDVAQSMRVPVRKAGARPEILELASGKRAESPGDSKERGLYIDSGGGDVNIGEGVLRSNGNGNGKHRNGNGH